MVCVTADLLRFENPTLACVTKLESDFLAMILHTRDEDMRYPHPFVNNMLPRRPTSQAIPGHQVDVKCMYEERRRV